MHVIIVNGKHKHVCLEQISYEQIVGIANEDRVVPCNTLHTVCYSYRRQSQGGELTSGQSVVVTDDLVVTALTTDRA